MLSGDVVTDIDLSRIIAFHGEHEALATIGLTPVDRPLEFGIVITREDGSIDRFLEKPTWGQVFSDTINTGIYVLEPEIFELIDPGRPVDFSAEVFPELLREGRPLFGAVTQGYWEDVGALDAYLRVHKDALDQMVQLDIPGFQVADGVWVGEGTEIAPDVETVGPAFIGPDCTIESGTRLGAYTVLGLALPGAGQRPARPVRAARQRVRRCRQPPAGRGRGEERQPAVPRARPTKAS